MLDFFRNLCYYLSVAGRCGGMADARDSKSRGAIRAGSSPATGIKNKVFISKVILLMNTFLLVLMLRIHIL